MCFDLDKQDIRFY